MTPRRNSRGLPTAALGGEALTLALRRDDWERASLLLLIAVATVIRNAPPGTIDDVLALLSDAPGAGGVR
jgi:hypothetical protein